MIKRLLPILTILLLFAACKQPEKHFITDEAYRQHTHEQYLSRIVMCKERDHELFRAVDYSKYPLEVQEAMEFMLAYMPLCDLADYDGEFFLKHVEASFQARDTFSWGKDIPEEIFRHFVVPCRVNNENLDSARLVFFKELKDRIKHLSLYNAALEVNHWCHEKVNYRPSDGRTSSPLATVRTSWGRCGEESTFTVTALRAVCIPARQVYTPRWAHTDSNHAWVEVYVDGKWQYLGACEPEPELNIGWFTEPVKRAMMVHTNVFGYYTGTDEELIKTPIYSKINLLSNYTTTKRLNVKVVDEKNTPINNATVKFGLYNYAEFYPLAEKLTDNTGFAWLTTGLGDLLIWANKDDKYAYSKTSVANTDTLVLVLNREPGEVYSEDMDIIPPIIKTPTVIPEEKLKENERRLAKEDAIRTAYMATFMDSVKAREFAQENNLPTDKIQKFIALSYGNWDEISKFMKRNAGNPQLFSLLENVSEKDIRDTRSRILGDHLRHTIVSGQYPDEIYTSAVLSPRVRNELLTPWRKFFLKKFDAEFTKKAHEDIKTVTNWIENNILLTTGKNPQVNDYENYAECPLTPIGVFNLKIADPISRDIFFVTLCRSVGIPARLSPINQTPQYYFEDKWVDVYFSDNQKQTPEQATTTATLVLESAKTNTLTPQYATNYTLAKFDNGNFTTLGNISLKEGERVSAPVSLEPGYYRLITGNRSDNGSVLARLSFFNLKEGKTTRQIIDVRPLNIELKELGKIDMNTSVEGIGTLSELSAKKGLVIAFIDPDKEPTKHVMNDIPKLKTEFELWGGGMLFMVPDDKLTDAFNPYSYNNLPNQVKFSEDVKRELLKTITQVTNTQFSNNFPLIVYITDNGNIVFLSEGYRIGIGESLIKNIQIANL